MGDVSTGGNYGGRGGRLMTSDESAGDKLRDVYGSLEAPIDFGSGGPRNLHASAGIGVQGGGILKIITPYLVNEGRISVDGSVSNIGGGGSGGLCIY